MLAAPMPSSTAALPGLALSTSPAASVPEGAGFGALMQRLITGLTESPEVVGATSPGMGAAALPTGVPESGMAAPVALMADTASLPPVGVGAEVAPAPWAARPSPDVVETSEFQSTEAAPIVAETVAALIEPVLLAVPPLMARFDIALAKLPDGVGGAPAALPFGSEALVPPQQPLPDVAAERPDQTAPVGQAAIASPPIAEAQPPPPWAKAVPTPAIVPTPPAKTGSRAVPGATLEAHPVGGGPVADAAGLLEVIAVPEPVSAEPRAPGMAGYTTPLAKPAPPPGPPPQGPVQEATAVRLEPVATATAQPALIETAHPPPASPIRQVLPLTIAMLIAPGTAPTLTVTLEPGEMGRLEIRIGRDAGGTTLRLIAERPETTALMQRDLRELQQGLAQSGVPLDAAAIRFETAGGGGAPPRDFPARAPLAAPDPAAPASLLDLRI